MKNINPFTDKLKVKESDYLDSAEIKEMYRAALKKHMERKDAFKFNVMLYALGG